MSELDKKLEKAHEMLEVQGNNGNWNYDSYMHGMYNGMEFMLALMEDREPDYRNAPDKWLYDIKSKDGLSTETDHASLGGEDE